MAKFQVVVPNEQLMNAYQSIISGKPDCWNVISEHEKIGDAFDASQKIDGRRAIRLADDPSPWKMISDFYRIDPDKMPKLAKWAAEHGE